MLRLERARSRGTAVYRNLSGREVANRTLPHVTVQMQPLHGHDLFKPRQYSEDYRRASLITQVGA